MRHGKPIDIPAMREKRKRLYLRDRRAFRLGLFGGVPVVLAVLGGVKLSGALPIEWPVVLVPPIGLTTYCLVGAGLTEWSWKQWCRSPAGQSP